MNKLLQTYIEKEPEIVFEWKDPLTYARGWIVINSLRGGASGGGTRMRRGLTKDEVISLAKVMGIKFTVSGPAIGGAKSGIDFDPSDPRREEVLGRWFKAVFPLLKNYYGTGGDLNVDELKDVVPLTEDLGLWHPQEGIVNGHFNYTKGSKIDVIGQLRHGCTKVVEDPAYTPPGKKKYAVADLITGWGVAESIKHYYDLFHDESSAGKRAIIQGWGNVASAAGYYLSKQNVRIVGIIDREGGLIHPEGMEPEEVTDLFQSREGNKLTTNGMIPFELMNEQIWDVPADIFVPGAASKLISPDQINRMIEQGLEVMSCGANVPFIDDEIFYGETAARTDQQISLIPDFIANAGMARIFAFLMERENEITDERIFDDVSHTIREALKEVYLALEGNRCHLSSKAMEIALKKLLHEDQMESLHHS